MAFGASGFGLQALVSAAQGFGSGFGLRASGCGITRLRVSGFGLQVGVSGFGLQASVSRGREAAQHHVAAQTPVLCTHQARNPKTYRGTSFIWSNPPLRSTIGPYEYSYYRVLGGGCFL